MSCGPEGVSRFNGTWNGGMVEWWNGGMGMVGGASLLNELEAKGVGALSVDFRRIFNLLEGQPPHN